MLYRISSDRLISGVFHGRPYGGEGSSGARSYRAAYIGYIYVCVIHAERVRNQKWSNSLEALYKWH